MNPIEQFKHEVSENIEKLGGNDQLKTMGIDFVRESSLGKYSYNFTWMGSPIIQYPQDIVAMQEIIWSVKPDLIIETGIAHGGSLIFYASMLELLGGKRTVLGIDIDIREHNRKEIEAHPMFKRIEMMEGSSIDPSLIEKVHALAAEYKTIMVVLDSMHTHAHVLEEMERYGPLVAKDSYMVVFDTSIDDMPDDFFPNRPWGRDNNPKTAVHEFLENNEDFKIDQKYDNKLLICVANNGYLKCVNRG